MALRHLDIDDFVELTLNKFERHKWTDISLEHQEYIASSFITEKKIQERGGPQIEFKVKTKNTGNARNTGLFARDVTKREQVMVPGKVPWAQQTTNFSYDIYEDMFQSDRETIIRELKVLEHDALSDMAELNEENLWSAPTGTTDTRPMGIPFWIQKATAAAGFNGGNPTGFTGGCAGIDSTTYTRWKNYTFNYTKVTPDDLVDKLKRALAFTHFMAPVPHPELGYGKSDYCIFTTYRIQSPLERLAESRNDNLGPDVAKYLNQVVVGGAPVKWVPYLEANDTSDPLYGVNWQVFRPYVKRGVDMRRNPPKIGADQHSVREVHYDNFCQYIALNRRRLFVGSK